MNYRIDHGGCGLSQRVGSRLCSVHLENVSRDVYDDIVIHALKLEKGFVGGDLKPRYEFGRGFRAQRLRKVLPTKGGTRADFLMSS